MACTYQSVIQQREDFSLKEENEDDKEFIIMFKEIRKLLEPLMKKDKYDSSERNRRRYQQQFKPRPDILNKENRTKDDKIKNEVIGELNKLSPKNIEKILKKVKDILNIHSVFIEHCIEHLFIMATAQSIFCELYTKFVSILKEDFPVIDTILKEKCDGFINVINEFKNKDSEEGYLNNVTQENYDKFCEGVKKKNFKKGFSQFICCLYKNDLIKKQYLRNTVEGLKKNLDISLVEDPKSSYTEDNIICLVETFRQCVCIVEQGDKVFIEMIKKTKGLPVRLKFKMMDLEDLIKKENK